MPTRRSDWLLSGEELAVGEPLRPLEGREALVVSAQSTASLHDREQRPLQPSGFTVVGVCNYIPLGAG
jgi:hypothetical protein